MTKTKLNKNPLKLLDHFCVFTTCWFYEKYLHTCWLTYNDWPTVLSETQPVCACNWGTHTTFAALPITKMVNFASPLDFLGERNSECLKSGSTL